MTAYDENDRKEASVHASIKPRSRPLVPPLRFSVVAFSPYPSNSAAPAPHSNHSQHAAAAACKDDVQATSPKIQDAPKDATSCLAQTLYRGSHPKARNLPFLSRLRLRSILSLTPKPLSKSGPFKASDDRIEEWAQRRGCRLEWIECEKGKEEEVALDRESADRAIAFILDKRNLPCYVHDLDALQVSSLLVALLRKVQAWSHASIQLEMRFNLCFGTGNVFKPNLSNTASQAGQSAKGTELEDDDSSVAMAFVKKWHQSAGPLQTRDPQSKSEARHALFADDLARPSAADGASAASTSKLQNGQLQLAPRRHIPDWVWPAPHPLSRLADPYDVLPFAAFAEVSKRDSQAVGREKDAKSSDGSSTASKNAPSVGNLSGRQSKRSSTLIEGAPDQAQYPFASNLTASTSVSARSSPRLVKAALPSAHGAAAHTPDTESVSSSSSGTAHIGVGSLPVLHPTLRLSFEVDPTLPAPPSSSKHAQKAEQPVHPQPGALSSRPATPARTSSPRPSGSSAVVRSRERTMLPPLSDQNRTLAFSAPTTPGPSRPQTPVRHANGSGSGNARSADASFQGKASSSPSISAAADLLRSANTSIGPSRATSPGRSASKLGDDARAAVEGDLADSKMETRSPAGVSSPDASLSANADSQRENATLGLVGLGLSGSAANHPAANSCASSSVSMTSTDSNATIRPLPPPTSTVSQTGSAEAAPLKSQEYISQDVFGPVYGQHTGSASTNESTARLVCVRSPLGKHAALSSDPAHDDACVAAREVDSSKRSRRPRNRSSSLEEIGGGGEDDPSALALAGGESDAALGMGGDATIDAGGQGSTDRMLVRKGKESCGFALEEEEEGDGALQSRAPPLPSSESEGGEGWKDERPHEEAGTEAQRQDEREAEPLEAVLAQGQRAELDDIEGAQQEEEEEEEDEEEGGEEEEEEEGEEEEEERYSEEEEEEEDSGSDRALEALDLEGW